jgi:hypothetical protein
MTYAKAPQLIPDAHLTAKAPLKMGHRERLLFAILYLTFIIVYSGLKRNRNFLLLRA